MQADQQGNGSNASRNRVVQALSFQEPDRPPRFFTFWPEYTDAWRNAEGAGAETDILDWYGSDLVVAIPDETGRPSRASVLERHGDEVIERTGWGAVVRRIDSAKFWQLIETSIPNRIDPDSLEFEDPLMASRYEEASRIVEQFQDRRAVFGKTGGPFSRPSAARGQEDFLADIAEDPGWVKAFIGRVMDHMTAVGVEQIRRFGLQDTGIGIYDDVCSNFGPIVGKRAYETLFYPSLRKMVRTYKEAGARFAYVHCDGNAMELLDLWIDAGIDAVHPLEPRVCDRPDGVFESYGKNLAVCGGLDNCCILPGGKRQQIRSHLEALIELAVEGGLIIAPHSVGADISVETMDYVLEILDGSRRSAKA